MEYFNGLPIDTGRLTTEIVMGCFAVLFVVFALFACLYALKKTDKDIPRGLQRALENRTE